MKEGLYIFNSILYVFLLLYSKFIPIKIMEKSMLISPNRHITELKVPGTSILKDYSAYPKLYHNHNKNKNKNKNKNRYKMNKHHISFHFYDESHVFLFWFQQHKK